MLPREKSVVGILTLAYLLAVTTSLKSLSVVPLALATTAYLLHLFTFDAIFYAKSRPRFYLLAAVNSLPYLAAAALGWWNATAYVVGFVLFAAYTALPHLRRGGQWRGDRRHGAPSFPLSLSQGGCRPTTGA